MPLRLLPAPEGFGWGQFREVRSAPDGSSFKASTGSRITITHIITERVELVGVRSVSDAVKIKGATVQVTIDRANTWVVRGQKTPALLEHERIHYLIATLVGKEILEQLVDQAAGTTAELQAKASSIHADETRRFQAIDSAYDDDSNHGTIEFQQRQWVAQVNHWRVTGIDW